MSILKIEAFSGLSGDMFLSALADLSGGYSEITALPEKLGISGEVEIHVDELNKNGIVCRHIKIIDRHKNQPEYHHPHRHLSDINRMIDQAAISGEAKNIAKKIFLELGQAESKVHGVSLEQIHFHEVGAIDSILDIVGCAVLLDRLQISNTYCTPVCTGSGFVNTAHGRLPVPTPATQYLLTGMPTRRGEVESEMTTPTGAAILRYLKPDFQIPVLADEKIGYGPGEKNFSVPNVLRLSLCSSVSPAGNIMMLQTNIDDMPSEYLGMEFQDKLLNSGAVDFYFEQVIMKKGRPGLVLNVLARKENLEALIDFIFRQTSSIGVRYFEAQRTELKRDIRELNSDYGTIRWKETEVPGFVHKRAKPESRDIFVIADRLNRSSFEIYREVMEEKGRGKMT